MGVTGILSSAWKIKLLVANSARWQQLVAPADPMDRIAIYMGSEKDIPFPRCIINDTSEGGTMEFRKISLGGWACGGLINATFEIEIPESAAAQSYEEEGNWLVTQTGQIVSEIMAANAPPSAPIGGEAPINLTAVNVLEGPNRLSWEERDEFDLMPVEGENQYPLWLQTFQFQVG